MACELLSHGLLDDCQSNVGGIKAIYFINSGNLLTQPLANFGQTPDTSDQLNTITLTPLTTSLYKYELKGANSFEQTITSSRENGTTFVEQTLTFTTKGLSALQTRQMKLLAFGRPQVIIHTNSNKFLLAGYENGMDVTTGTISNGTAFGDLVGYTMTLQGMEPIPANHINVNSPYGATEIKLVTGNTSVIVTV